ncbi:MAG TPA: single-stranded DNA-binding protein [Phycisphaerae bacterium]|jgi:single-strand DNA-binding protein
MANLNKVMLIGNLTRDIEVRYLPSNQMPVCDFGLATNRTWTGQDGVKKEEVTFVDCTAFGKQAEILGKYKKKGDPLFIEGRLKLDQWEKEGVKHSKLKVVVENFQFLNRGQPGGYGGGGGQAADPGEYGGEPQSAPAPQQRQPYRQPGRPMQAARPAPAAPAPAPNYDNDIPSMPADEGAQIAQEDIPF